MDIKDETLDTWNKVASVYQDKFMDLELYNDTYDYIINTVEKSNAKILEIGCGPGNITKYLLSKRPDFEIFGIDISPKMIELAKLNNPTAKFALMDSREINKLDIKYDAMIGGFCLPYLSESESVELITNSYDLLNENGLIYLSLVEGDPRKSGFKVGHFGRVYFYFHDLNVLKEQLTKTNFEEIKVVHLQHKISESEYDTHTILTAKKIV